MLKLNNKLIVLLYLLCLTNCTDKGLSDIDTDLSYVYLLYSGSSLLDKESSAYTSNIVLVYNWEGIPVKRYVLDHSVISIYIRNNMLWCIGENHKYLYKYVLSL